jgi:hypothetical protein
LLPNLGIDDDQKERTALIFALTADFSPDVIE